MMLQDQKYKTGLYAFLTDRDTGDEDTFEMLEDLDDTDIPFELPEVSDAK